MIKRVIPIIFLILFLFNINSLLNYTYKTQLILGGSSSSSVLFRDWIYSFEKLHPTIKINYQPTGSTSAQRQLLLNLVHMSSSDIPVSREIQKKAEKSFLSFLHIPIGISPIAIVYNLDVSTPICLTPDIIASVLLGTINRWDDQQILQVNPSIQTNTLDLPITVVSRSDASGSTGILTDFLFQSTYIWREKIGKTIYSFWDPPKGFRIKGGSAAAILIRKNLGSFGYLPLELAQKLNLPIAAVLNQSGNWILPSKESCMYSVIQIADLLISTTDSIVNTKHPKGYPILGFNWLIIPQRFSKNVKEEQIDGILLLTRWITSESATTISENRGFFSIPFHRKLKELISLELRKSQIYRKDLKHLI